MRARYLKWEFPACEETGATGGVASRDTSPLFLSCMRTRYLEWCGKGRLTVGACIGRIVHVGLEGARHLVTLALYF